MCYNGGMKLSRSVEKVLMLLTAFLLVFVLTFVANKSGLRAVAENEEGTFVLSESNFVTFYDNGKKLTVRTDAKTVGEAIARAGITLGDADIVEPAMEEAINSDNYFINIYRARPVVVKDGKIERYVMTASYDLKTIAKQAGSVVYDGDEVRVLQNKNFLETGVATVYEIIRNGGRIVTEEIEIPFGEQTVKDYNLAPGVREVRQLGEVGIRVMSYEVFYENGVEVKRDLLSEEIKREPVDRIVAVGASEIERHPLTAAMGRNRYTVRKPDGTIIERQETYYDLDMRRVMANAARVCGVANYYTVRADGVKVDADGYVLVAANLGRYPRCSVVETSLGLGKVYDTGTFAEANPEQFDIATDWTNRNGQ